MQTHTTNPSNVKFAADSVINPALLTVPQACQRLNCARSRLYELFLSGDLPRVKFGGRTLIPLDSINQFLAGLIDAAEDEAAARRAGGR